MCWQMQEKSGTETVGMRRVFAQIWSYTYLCMLMWQVHIISQPKSGAYMYANVCMHAYLYTYMYINMHMSMYIYVHVIVCVYVYVYLYVYVYYM